MHKHKLTRNECNELWWDDCWEFLFGDIANNSHFQNTLEGKLIFSVEKLIFWPANFERNIFLIQKKSFHRKATQKISYKYFIFEISQWSVFWWTHGLSLEYSKWVNFEFLFFSRNFFFSYKFIKRYQLLSPFFDWIRKIRG